MSEIRAVPVVCRAKDTPDHPTTGFAPSVVCPLAVTPVATFDDAKREWVEHEARWCITHRPTGLTLGPTEWDTRKAALDVLAKCDPDFPAWALATGGRECLATLACRVKFRGACAG
jgi:hypothetical protein